MKSTQYINREIPSPFPHNHASNLLELDNGDLLCTWFGGSREGRSDISILISRLEKGTGKWSDPVVLDGNPNKSEQNPILFKNPNGETWLVYTAQDLIFQDSAVVNYRISKDEGETWSNVETLFSDSGSFVRNPPVILDNGDIVFPAYYSLKSDTGFLGNDRSVVKITSDNGLTWREYDIPNSKGLVHMSIVKSDSALIGFFRSRKSDNIYQTKSLDNGHTWSIPEKTDLPNNNASIQCIRLNNGNLMIIFNDTNAKNDPPKENRPPWFDKADMEKVTKEGSDLGDAIWGVIRSPLVVAVSEDEGNTWSQRKVIITKDDVDQAIDSPEFSYPSIIQTKDNKIHISFTYLREWIRHVELPEVK